MSPADRRTRLLLGCLAAVGVGAALRLGGLSHQSLWFDEVFSLLVSARSPAEIWRLAEGEFHPPGYHVFLHLWSLLAGSGEASARSLSALAGILTIPAIWAACRALPTPDESGAAAGWLVATSPLLVEYSQEARAYSLAALLAVLAWIVQERAVRRPSLQAWMLFAVLAAGGVMLHYYFGFILLALAVGFLTAGPDGRSLRAWAAAQVAILLLVSPWLAAFGRQVRMADQDFPYHVLRLYDVGQTVKNLSVRYPFVGSTGELFSWGGALVSLGLLLSWGLILLALSRLGCRRIRVPLVLVLVPFLGSLVVSRWVPLHHFHFFVIVAPFFCALLAAGLATITTARGRALALAGVILVNLTSVGWYYMGAEASKADVRGAAAYLADRYRDGDWILHGSTQTFFPSWYYHGGRLQEVVLAGSRVPVYDGGELLAPADRVDPATLLDRARAYTRLWYVALTPTRGDRASDEGRNVLPGLPGWQVVDRRDFYWVTVVRFERQAAAGRPAALDRRPGVTSESAAGKDQQA